MSREDIAIYRFIKLYILLLVFEGIFRKWIQIVPVDVFYFLRDLIGFVFCFKLFLFSRIKMYEGSRYFFYLMAIVIASCACFVAVTIQNVPIGVALFGIRNYLSLLIIAFILSYLRDFRFLFRTIYRAYIYCFFIQLPIIVLQVLSGPEAFINKTSWDLGASLFTSGEVVRPPGTFTNALGLGYFLLTCLGLVLSNNLKGGKSTTETNLNYIAFICIVGISAIAGSRTLIFGLFVTLFIYFVFRITKNPLSFSAKVSVSPLLRLFTLLGTLFALYKLINVINAFFYRLQYQTEGSQGTLNRIIDSIFGYQIESLTWFGSGIGTRHQSAIALGWSQPWVENEILRWSAELGLVGFLLIILRQFWICKLAVQAFTGKFEGQYLVPIIFVSLGPILLSGLSTQPSVQGASAILIGIIYHSSKFTQNRLIH